MSSPKAGKCGSSARAQEQAHFIKPATTYAAMVATPYTAGASHQHPTSNRHRKHSHHQSSKPHQEPDTQAPAQPAPKSPEDDLATWTDLTFSRFGASLRTVCTCKIECEGAETKACPHRADGKESRYANIPRVNEPAVRLEVAAVRRLQDEDAMMEDAERDEGGHGDIDDGEEEEREREDGWVVVS